MNNKLLTAAIIISLSLFGVGAVIFMKDDSKKSHSSGQNNTNTDTTEGPASSQASNNVEEADKVSYKGFAVVQKAIKVKKGTTVTWTNEDSAKHDVTPVTETAEFKASPLFGKGETYQVTFSSAGTYEYFCSPHPYMKGTVEVTD